MKIYVIRHGETKWNKERRLQGQQGSDLDEQGVKLAEMTADALADVPFDICYTSPLVRAEHTARIIVGRRDIPIVIEPRIMEIGFGVWEGKSCDLNHMGIPLENYMTFHDDAYHYVPPEGGESIQDVIDRTHSFYEELIHNPDLADKTVLVSTHGCAARAFLHNVYEDTTDFWHGGVPMNCAVSVIDVENGVGKLVQDDKVYYPKKYYSNFYDDQLAQTIEAEEKEKDRQDDHEDK